MRLSTAVLLTMDVTHAGILKELTSPTHICPISISQPGSIVMRIVNFLYSSCTFTFDDPADTFAKSGSSPDINCMNEPRVNQKTSRPRDESNLAQLSSLSRALSMSVVSLTIVLSCRSWFHHTANLCNVHLLVCPHSQIQNHALYE